MERAREQRKSLTNVPLSNNYISEEMMVKNEHNQMNEMIK